ncbi:MAG: cytochrome C oxidase subunit IV family protein [Candidatus Kapaibacteriota bacterium]|jgi:cytochrome c oxidase subunit 4
MSNHSEVTHQEHEHHEHLIGYGAYTIIWASLLALTAVTVAVAGINLGTYTLFVAMLVATIKAMIVINVFMHIKYDSLLFKGIVAVCGIILIIIFTLLGVDVFTTVR